MGKRKQILVTGGAGYIGSHTVVALTEAGYKPIILDNFSNSEKHILKQLEQITGQTIEAVEGDVRDEKVLSDLFSRFDIYGVIHFAAYKAVGESVQDPLKYYDNNLTGLVSLLKSMHQAEVKRFVFSSSCTVYGIPEGNICVTEESPLGIPSSPYGWTKWMGERIIQDTVTAMNLGAVILRYFNPIGAHESGLIGELPQGVPNNILPYMTQTAAGLREQLTVFGNDYPTPDGTCIRDYIHVVDLAEAHVKALEVKANSVRIYNLGTGLGTSVLELIHAFEEATGKPMNWTFGPRRDGDVTAIYAKVDRAKEELGWVAKRTVGQAIKDAWKWETYRIEHEI